jgi:hypothetical protein
VDGSVGNGAEPVPTLPGQPRDRLRFVILIPETVSSRFPIVDSALQHSFRQPECSRTFEIRLTKRQKS